MKDLKHYLKESVLDDVFAQIEIDDADKMMIIKKSITNWLKNNLLIRFQENKLSFDFSTAPIIVNYDGDIKCKTNITSLTNGVFQWGVINGDFDCLQCKSLESLKGAPKEVVGDFICSECYSLESLEGAPKKVGLSFLCDWCDNLKSLKGAPKEVGMWFDCGSCTSLKTLEGAPEKVGGDFRCEKCALKSLKGAPKEIGDSFYCRWGKTKFTEDDVRNVSNVKGRIYC